MLNKIKNNLVIQKILSMTLVLVWMITVFIFSSQDGTETLNTSGAFIHAIDSKISNSQVESNSNNKQADEINPHENEEYKYKCSTKVQKIVRKNAHYFLYMIGGVILSVFFCVISSKKVPNENRITIKKVPLCKKCIFCAIMVGILYAITDELHQSFIPGRTSSIKDVFIDSLGIITGIILTEIFRFILQKHKDNVMKMGE